MKNKNKKKMTYYGDDEDFHIIKGLMYAIPLGIACWGFIIWLICRD